MFWQEDKNSKKQKRLDFKKDNNNTFLKTANKVKIMLYSNNDWNIYILISNLCFAIFLFDSNLYILNYNKIALYDYDLWSNKKLHKKSNTYKYAILAVYFSKIV